jgi:hypothetical protein
MSDNSKVNRTSSSLADEAADRAVARHRAVTKAVEATTGQAGLEEGKAQKGMLEIDSASDLK